MEDVEGGKLVTYLYRDFPLGSVRLSYGEADSTSSIFREKEKEQLSTESVEPIAALDGWLIVSLFALLLLLIFFIIVTAKIVTPRKKYR